MKAITMSDKIKEVRVLVDDNGCLRRFFKIFFSGSDTSFYLVPYTLNHRFSYGTQTFEEGVSSKNFHTDDQFSTENYPKLSVHESGVCHVLAPNDLPVEKAGPVKSIHFAALKGEAVAGAYAWDLKGLPLFEGTPRQSGDKRDVVLCHVRGNVFVRAAIYVNGYERKFKFQEVRLKRREKKGKTSSGGCPNGIITLNRPMMDPVHIGIAFFPHPIQVYDKAAPGIIVIAGWNPDLPVGAKQDFLFIKGE